MKYDLKPLITSFEAYADPVRAKQMRAYMKDQFDYLGLQTPVRKELTKAFYTDHGYPDPAMVQSIVEECWQMPYREYKYFALELMVNYVIERKK